MVDGGRTGGGTTDSVRIAVRFGIERWLWYSVRREGLDEELVRHSHLFAGDVLEIGAGAQRRGRFVPPKTDSWIRCDLDTGRRPDVVADVQNLPYLSGRFDVVVCLEVFEYLDCPRAALEELRGVLKPSGLLMLSVPFMHRMDAENDYWRFTQNGLIHLLRSSGFQVVECTQQGCALAVAAEIVKQAIRTIDSSVLRKGVGVVLAPLVWGLRRLDGCIGAASEVLRGSSTGYVCLSRQSDDVAMVRESTGGASVNGGADALLC